MKPAENIIEMRHEAAQTHLFARTEIGIKAFAPVNLLIARAWTRVGWVQNVVEWEIEGATTLVTDYAAR